MTILRRPCCEKPESYGEALKQETLQEVNRKGEKENGGEGDFCVSYLSLLIMFVPFTYSCSPNILIAPSMNVLQFTIPLLMDIGVVSLC